MPIPLLAYLAMAGGGAALDALGRSSQSKAQKQMTREQLQAEAAQIAFKESLADPFRGQMMQMGDLSKLDMLRMAPQSQRGVVAPAGRTLPQGYAPGRYVPTEDLMNWASLMQQNVASGRNIQPSVTAGPGAYGTTSALDLNDILTNTRDPRAAMGARPPAPPNTAIRRPGGRREV